MRQSKDKMTIFCDSQKVLAFCIVIVLLIFLLSLCLPKVLFRELSAKEIFNKNANTVVEVKAGTDSVGESFGTGEFIRNDGILVTNAHVVTYSLLGEATAFDNFYIRFMDSDDYLRVELIKFDTNLDIAFLKYSRQEHIFTVADINKTQTLQSGEKVYAIGNAMNYGLAISSGLISIPLVNIIYDGVTKSVIQCDITIAEGNSGGALLDSYGRLIGMTTFRTKDNAGNVVFGFAYCIPIFMVIDYLEK